MREVELLWPKKFQKSKKRGTKNMKLKAQNNFTGIKFEESFEDKVHLKPNIKTESKVHLKPHIKTENLNESLTIGGNAKLGRSFASPPLTQIIKSHQ